MSAHVTTFTMTSEPGQLARMRSWLWTQLVGQALPLEECSAFLVAVGEICNNVIKHAYRGQPNHPIELHLAVDEARLELSIRDEGDKFDLRTYQPPDLNQPREGGYGIFIIRSLMDEVEYDTSAERGTTLRLVKYRGQPAP